MTKAANAPGTAGLDIVSRVLHRDGLMLVIDKPAGIPVHRGPRNARDKSGTALEDTFEALRFGLPRPPVLAHRLDRDTSGCLILGRHRKATASLGLLFKHNRISKTYWAVVEGEPDADSGTIDIPLGRLNEERGWWQKPDPDGLPATTRWRVLGRASAGELASEPIHAPSPPPRGEGSGVGVAANAEPAAHPPPQPSPARGEGVSPGVAMSDPTALTWLALEPVTGRTHQLRVHCAAMGWPIVGDTIYGHAPREGGPMLHLHARAISIPLSKNKPPVDVAAPVPDHMRERLGACGWRE